MEHRENVGLKHFENLYGNFHWNSGQVWVDERKFYFNIYYACPPILYWFNTFCNICIGYSVPQTTSLVWGVMGKGED